LKKKNREWFQSSIGTTFCFNIQLTKINMKISFAITVKDELTELDRLLNKLFQFKRPEDEIVIVFDKNNGSHQVEDYLRAKSVSQSLFRWYPYKFEGHFADLKNFLTSQCTGDYVFNIDADEYPEDYLLNMLPKVLEQNPQIDVFLVPRVNTVEGITEEHIKKWNWKLDEEGRINFPDFQWRVYRRTSDITWVNKVHERLSGYKTFTAIPAYKEWSLIHPKSISKQESQNKFYDTLS